jgi:hypothetical protein
MKPSILQDRPPLRVFRQRRPPSSRSCIARKSIVTSRAWLNKSAPSLAKYRLFDGPLFV